MDVPRRLCCANLGRPPGVIQRVRTASITGWNQVEMKGNHRMTGRTLCSGQPRG
jgi:hypothetical protein